MTPIRKSFTGRSTLCSRMTSTSVTKPRISSNGTPNLRTMHAQDVVDRDPLCRLITSQDRRLAVDAIKSHPFFLGVNWNTIRQIEAPFIPRLRSMTDTSYFPTEELEQVPEEPVNADSTGAQKDLAFLGYVMCSALLALHCSRLMPPFPVLITAFCLPHIDIPSSGSRSRRKHSYPLMVYASPYRPVYHLLYSSGLDHSGNSAQAFW